MRAKEAEFIAANNPALQTFKGKSASDYSWTDDIFLCYIAFSTPLANQLRLVRLQLGRQMRRSIRAREWGNTKMYSRS